MSPRAGGDEKKALVVLFPLKERVGGGNINFAFANKTHIENFRTFKL